MTVILRQARPGDAPALVELFRQLGYESDVDAVRPRLAHSAGTGAHILVAEMGAGVCGVAVVHLIEPVHVADRWALLSALVVDESGRGNGVGALLLDAAERHAWEAGCSQIELSSSEHRTRAHAFYDRQGYAERRKRFLKRHPVS